VGATQQTGAYLLGNKPALGEEGVEGHDPAVPIWAPSTFVYRCDQVVTEVLPLSTGDFDR